MQKLLSTCCVAIIALGVMSQPALAVKAFSDQFMKLYKVDKKAEKQTEFSEAVLKAKCFTCHQGKKKKDRNLYGMELSVLLDKKKDAKNPEKIVEALEKVATMHSDPKDKKSPTFGELIKAGKLPGGSLEDCKKKPEERWPDGVPEAGSVVKADAKGSGKK